MRHLLIAATVCGLTIAIAACGHTTTERAATGAAAGAVVSKAAGE